MQRFAIALWRSFKSTAIYVGIVYSIFAILLLVLKFENEFIYFVAFIACIMMPIGHFIYGFSGNLKQLRFQSEGVRNTYIPMFKYLGGLDCKKNKKYFSDLSLAIFSNKEVIFCFCDPSLCKDYSNKFWEELHHEYARIPLNSVSGVYAFPADPEKLKDNKTEALLSNTAINLTLGKILGYKLTSSFVEAFIVISYSVGAETQHATFGIYGKQGGFPFDLESLIPDVAPIENVLLLKEIGSFGWELMTLDQNEPQSMQTAKTVANRFMATTANLRSPSNR